MTLKSLLELLTAIEYYARDTPKILMLISNFIHGNERCRKIAFDDILTPNWRQWRPTGVGAIGANWHHWCLNGAIGANWKNLRQTLKGKSWITDSKKFLRIHVYLLGNTMELNNRNIKLQAYNWFWRPLAPFINVLNKQIWIPVKDQLSIISQFTPTWKIQSQRL